MKTISPALTALLSAGNQFFVAELYTITLVDDTVFRVTSGDGDIDYDDEIFYGSYGVKLADPVPTWTLQLPIKQFRSAAMSADGSKVLLTVFGSLYLSTDGGATLTAIANTSFNWFGCAASADGSKLVAVVGNNKIYTSDNGGGVWVAHDANRAWRDCAMSADGSVLMAVVANGKIYRSVDSGASWAAVIPFTRNFVRCAMSADGQVWVAVVSGGGWIYLSTDGGTTWLEVGAYASWLDCAVSADGQRIIATTFNQPVVYVSTDGGSTFAQKGAGFLYTNGCATSADGMTMLIVTETTLYKSVDGGDSWAVVLDSLPTGYCCALSADGSKMVVGTLAGVYTLSLVTPVFSNKDLNFSISREAITSSVGVTVDECALMLRPTPESRGLLQKFSFNGAFDGASVAVDLAIMPSYGDLSAGVVPVFEGLVTDVAPDLSGVKLTVSSELVLLDAMFPRHIYQPTCLHMLFDDRCGLTKSSYTATYSVGTNSTRWRLNASYSEPERWFDLGSVTFTSGENKGATRTVKAFTQQVAQLSAPFDFTPAVGDGFLITAGCDKLRTTCANKFNNAANFLGFEYMPHPEAAV